MLSNLTKSTISSKITVAVTGIILVGFIIGHTLGNLQMFLGREVFNHYGEMLRVIPELLWGVRLLLLIAVILHIFATIKLRTINSAAKPISYKKVDHRNATLASKSMFWAGLMILFFVIYHLLHFTIPSGLTPPHGMETYEFGVNMLNQRPDIYTMAIVGFRDPLSSVIYIFGVVALGMHLSHGIQSMFQTLGIYGDSFSKKIRKASVVFAVLITLALASIPLSILIGLVGGDVQ